MEVMLVVLVALVVLVIGPLALILALVNRSEIGRLRRELAGLRAASTGAAPAAAPEPGRPEATPAPVAPDAAPAASREAAAVASATPPAPPMPPPRTRDVEALVGGQWLTWLGVLTIFFGTSFFLAVDLTGSPLSGMGQVLIGVAVAAVFALLGSRFSDGPRRVLGLGLLSGAVALLFLAGYAATAFHALLPPIAVYPLLVAAGIVGAALALRQNAAVVAILTVGCALLAPLLLQQKANPGGLLFAYLVAVDLGGAMAAARRRWSAVPLIAFLGTVLVVALWWDAHYAVGGRTVAFAGTAALWLLFAALPLVTVSRPGFWGVARAVVVLADGLLFLAAMLVMLAPDLVAFRGLGTALLALLYVLAAFRRRAASPAAAMTYYTGLILAALAVPAQLDAAWVTLGWALIALVLLVAGTADGAGFGHRLLGYAVLLAALFHLATWDTAETVGYGRPETAVLNANFAVGAGAALLVLVAGIVLSRRRAALPEAERFIPTGLVLAGVTALLWRISAESIGAFEARERLLGPGTSLDLASMLTLSLIWAVYAAATIGAGFVFRRRPLRVLGMAFLGVLIVKMFLLDIQELERGYRIASFVGVGVLLLAISLLYQRERRT